MKNIVIIDYDCGNILSLKRALSKINLDSKLSRNTNEISNATHLILPGVGAFGSAMNLLKKYKLTNIIKDHAKKGKPLLGICLGMQLLLTKSFEFGETEGLNLIEGKVEKITDQTSRKIKVPHIGWSEINFEKEKKLFNKFEKKNFYFIHSFIAKTLDKESTIAYANFEELKIPAIIKKKNICGFQFHPEKSHISGLELIQHFFDQN